MHKGLFPGVKSNNTESISGFARGQSKKMARFQFYMVTRSADPHRGSVDGV